MIKRCEDPREQLSAKLRGQEKLLLAAKATALRKLQEQGEKPALDQADFHRTVYDDECAPEQFSKKVRALKALLVYTILWYTLLTYISI